MELSSISISFAAVSCIIAITVFTSYSKVHYLLSHRAHYLTVHATDEFDDEENDELYDDPDGARKGLPSSTSTSVFARQSHLSTLTTGICAFSALFTSLGIALYLKSTVESWTLTIAWLLLLVQYVMMSLEGSAQQKAYLSCLFGVSVAFELVCLGAQVCEIWLGPSIDPKAFGLAIAVHVMMATLSLSASIASLSRPGQAIVFYHGRAVDPEGSVSALERFTFSWTGVLFHRRPRGTKLGLQDLPLPGPFERAISLSTKFRKNQRLRNGSLWRSMYYSHRSTLHLQWSLTIMQSLASYAPQFCIYRIITLLEHETTPDSRRAVWLWALALGLACLSFESLNAILTWISFAKLEVLVRSQLSNAIFEKALKKDIVQEADSTVTNVEKDTSNRQSSDEAFSDEEVIEAVPLMPVKKNSSIPSDSPAHQDSESPAKKEPVEPEAKRQVINLLTVDANRIAEMSSRHNIFLGTFVTFVAAVFFLVQLLGWISFLTGLIGPLLFIPLNMFASKAYGGAQYGVMKSRDEKLKRITEAMKGIRQIKFTATEDRWEKEIMESRVQELAKQRVAFVWTICLRFFWQASPIILATVALSTYALIHGSISASVAFTALGVFANLEWCFSVLPMATMQVLDARISAHRVKMFLESAEKASALATGDNIEFSNATVSWPSESDHKDSSGKFTLKSLHMRFPNEKLSIIYGPSGSGKTLILESIVGEAKVTSGRISVPNNPAMLNEAFAPSAESHWVLTGSMAYVPQTPWLENASIRSNILFGLPYVPNRYRQVLHDSALLPDLKSMPDDDQTEIGAQGINLSGGQRWRISFARALYSRASILVLDDIFSAVDAHVGAHLLRFGLMGVLATGRTRILATHHATLCLPWASYAVHIARDGSVKAHDLPGNRVVQANNLDTRPSQQATQSTVLPEESVWDEDMHSLNKVKPKKFVEEEGREEGAIKGKTYKTYLTATGGFRAWGVAFSMIVLSQVAMFGRGWWIKLWTSSTSTTAIDRPNKNLPDQRSKKDAADTTTFYLIIYIVVSLAAASMEAVKCAFVYAAALRASRELFKSSIHTVLRAKLRWLDTTPMGRIINRFTSDFALIDTRIPGDSHTFLSAVLSLCAIFVAGGWLSPYTLVSSAVLSMAALFFVAKYLRGATEIKRLEAVSRSPILEFCGTSLVGLNVIRAFNRVTHYSYKMQLLIDDCTSASTAFWLVTQWMALRMGMLGAIYTLTVAITIASLGEVEASLAGFALAFSMNMTKSTEEAVQRYANLQMDMNSTERVIEYSQLDAESDAGQSLPKDWPPLGKIVIENLEVGYDPSMPPALRGVSATLHPQQRVGIVGRTGSGKSSLALALFRFINPSSGRIVIDGLDIAKVNVRALRSRMAIVPQDPVLFSGTIRSNLDPFAEFSDHQIRRSLQSVHLLDTSATATKLTSESVQLNDAFFEDLDSGIAEGGLNLSQGQRQLLCLARAFLMQSSIMIMDEATSAIDRDTDDLIQRAIREEFSKSTLVVIAHRLSTVVDFDTVVVLKDGNIAELGAPKDLFSERGEFWRLIMESGDKEELVEALSSRK